MDKNLLFDGRMMNMSGIGRYSQELHKNLFLERRNEFDHLLILMKEELKVDTPSNLYVKSKVFSFNEQFELYKVLKSKKKYIFHSPHFVFPIAYNGPLVLTIHDITPLLFPEIFSKAGRLYMKFFLELAKKKASKIIAVSNQTKSDLIEHLDMPEDKIVTIYNGVDLEFFNTVSVNVNENYNHKYNLKDYILYAGNIRPHKNLETLLKAIYLLHKKNYKIPLVIVGQKKNSYENLDQLINKLNLRNYIIFTGWVENEELKFLYQNATLFAYPSLYEGFGLPPLEAMACGTPVVTTDISSIPEVVGDAALKVSALNSEAMSEAIGRILESKELQNQLRQKGLERVRVFQWDKSAKEVLRVYEDIWNNR